MSEIAWITAFTAGVTATALAALAAFASRDPGDRRFVVFLGLFLVHTAFYLSPTIMHKPLEPNSSVYLAAAMAMATSLPAYTAARTGRLWLRALWKITALLSILILALIIIMGHNSVPTPLGWPFLLVRIFVSAIVLASVLPLMRQGGTVEVERIPPKSYRIAGTLTITFAIISTVPAFVNVPRQDSGELHLAAYLVFAILLNLRFITYLLPRILRKLSSHFDTRAKAFQRFAVSPREQEVYDLLAKGYRYKEIARLLSISLSTVKTHVDRLYRKTDSTNKVELIREIDG